MPLLATLSVWEEDRSKTRKRQKGNMIASTKVCTECYRNNGEAPNFENQFSKLSFENEPAKLSRATVPGRDASLTNNACSRRGYVLGKVWIHF